MPPRLCGRVPQGPQRNRLRRRTKRGGGVPLAGGPIRPPGIAHGRRNSMRFPPTFLNVSRRCSNSLWNRPTTKPKSGRVAPDLTASKWENSQAVSGGIGDKGSLQAHLETLVPVPKIPAATPPLAEEKAPAVPLRQCNSTRNDRGPGSQSGRQFGPLRSAFAGRTPIKAAG